MGVYFLLGLAMMLIIEGLFPFVFPKAWRETFSRIILMSDHQIRWMALMSMAAGLVLLYLVK